MSSLNLCPKCQSIAIVRGGGGINGIHYSAYCLKCGHTGPEGTTADAAAELWNSRREKEGKG